MAQSHTFSSDDPRIIDSTETFFSKNLYALIVTVVLILALACVATWLWGKKQSQEDAALRLYSTAKTPEEVAKVLQTYPSTPASALALIDIAEKEITARNYSSAITHYQEFLKQFSGHPAAPCVELALAICQENSGKTAEARAEYDKILGVKPAHPFVGSASIGIARLYLKENNLPAARQALSDFIANNEERNAANEARELLNSLPPAQK